MIAETTKQFLVLLTDDDEDDRELFEETIDEIDTKTKVLTLGDGRQLMDYLTDKCNAHPDILFLDINMPHKDGFQCLKEIKNDTRLRNICVIMYSTSDAARDVKKAYDFGADGYIQKPSRYADLKNILQNVLDTDWKDPCRALDEHSFVIQP